MTTPLSPEAKRLLRKLNGAKGGRVRAKRLSSKRRREIAQHAALVRHGKITS